MNTNLKLHIRVNELIERICSRKHLDLHISPHCSSELRHCSIHNAQIRSHEAKVSLLSPSRSPDPEHVKTPAKSTVSLSRSPAAVRAVRVLTGRAATTAVQCGNVAGQRGGSAVVTSRCRLPQGGLRSICIRRRVLPTPSAQLICAGGSACKYTYVNM